MTARKRTPLFTIGYEKAKPGAVLGELKRAKVKLLVDTRAVAASRRPGFSKRQLAAALDEHGIAYLHLQKLGTPDEGRQAARAGELDTLWRIYAKHLKTPEAIEAMDELIVDREIRAAGVPALLRARQGLLPPQPHRRDRARAHRRAASSISSRRCSERLFRRLRHLEVALDAVDQQRDARGADRRSRARSPPSTVSTRSKPPRLCRNAIMVMAAPEIT